MKLDEIENRLRLYSWPRPDAIYLIERLQDAEEALKDYADDDHWIEEHDCDGICFDVRQKLYIQGPEIAKSYFDKYKE
jgi:hypothetical protein